MIDALVIHLKGRALDTWPNLVLYFLTPLIVLYAFDAVKSKVSNGIYKKILYTNILGQTVLIFGRWLQLGAVSDYQEGDSADLCFVGKFFEMLGVAIYTTSNTTMTMFLNEVYHQISSFQETETYRYLFPVSVILGIFNVIACSYIVFGSTMGIYFPTYCFTLNAQNTQALPLFWCFLINILAQLGFIARSFFIVKKARKNALRPPTTQETALLHSARLFSLSYCFWFLPFMWVAYQVSYTNISVGAFDNILLNSCQLAVVTEFLVFSYLKRSLDRYDTAGEVPARTTSVAMEASVPRSPRTRASVGDDDRAL